MIDLSSLLNEAPDEDVVTSIRSACLDVGFFYVVKHGIDSKLQEKVFKRLGQFFTLPAKKKHEIHRKDGFRGYFNFVKEKSKALSTLVPSGKKGYIILVNSKMYLKIEVKLSSVVTILGQKKSMSMVSNKLYKSILKKLKR